MATRDRRVGKELQDIALDRDNSGVYIEDQENASSLKNLIGVIPGPPDTPYAGGKYKVDIEIPDGYPFKPPKMKVITKIWHPNISSQTGALCLDTLTTGWSPVQTIKTVLLSIGMLLQAPNPDDPQDAQVANQLKEDPESFAQTAQSWAIKYAGAKKTEMDMSRFQKEKEAEGPQQTMQERCRGYSPDLVLPFTNMGFSVEAVVNAMATAHVPKNGGMYYEMEEAYMGDVTAILLGEN